jgi:hypothetical protein
MIVAAVLCPHPPLLFRELAGAVDSARDLRAACRDALTEALALQPDQVVVVGAADESGVWTGAPDVRRFGTTGPRPATPGLPLSVGVGQRLLEEAGWAGPTELRTLPWDADDLAVAEIATELSDKAGHLALLLLGDGSTRRGAMAPGYLDPRSFAFDETTSEALVKGDAEALRHLDVALAEQLMVLGRTVFRLMGALGAPTSSRLFYDDDPFGVAYHVALWTYA